MSNSAFSSWPQFSEEEILSVSDVLASGKVNYWTGSKGKQFESAFAEYLGCKHALAVSNGTVSLELALKALQIGQGDEVIVPSRTFIATASSVVACQATPIIADVDYDTQNITVETIKAVVTSQTKAVIVVHLAGLSCDMDPIMQFARAKNIKVIEDCAQAHGAKYKDRYVGTIGDMGSYSFCQDKIMTTGGEGGLLVTNHSDLWQNAWSYRDHGKSYEETMRADHPPGFRWLHHSFGSNFRMTEMQSTIGLIQLKRLKSWVEKRRANASQLLDVIKTLPGIQVFEPSSDYYHAYYKFYATLVPEELKSDWNRARIIETLASQGIPCFEGSCSEIYKEQAFIKAGLAPEQPMPKAKKLGETSLMFLVDPTITHNNLEKMLKAIMAVFQEATLSSATAYIG